MDNFLYPSHPVRYIFTGPSECGKSVFLTKLNWKIFIDFAKLFMYSTSLHQGLYPKSNYCSSNYIPKNIIANNLNEEELDLVN